MCCSKQITALFLFVLASAGGYSFVAYLLFWFLSTVTFQRVHYVEVRHKHYTDV